MVKKQFQEFKDLMTRKGGIGMLAFISENLSTIIVSLIILAIVVLIVVKLIRDKKKGKSCSCGCGCSDCPSSSICHH